MFGDYSALRYQSAICLFMFQKYIKYAIRWWQSLQEFLPSHGLIENLSLILKRKKNKEKRKSFFCIEWNVIKANHKGLFGKPESLNLLMYPAIVNDCLMRHFQKLNISYYKVALLKRGHLYRVHIISKSSFDKNINNLWYQSNLF